MHNNAKFQTLSTFYSKQMMLNAKYGCLPAKRERNERECFKIYCIGFGSHQELRHQKALALQFIFTERELFPAQHLYALIAIPLHALSTPGFVPF